MDHQASIQEVKIDTPQTQGVANDPSAPRKTRIILKRSTTPSSPSPQVSSSLEEPPFKSPKGPKKRRSPRSRAKQTSATASESPNLDQPLPEPPKPKIKLRITHKNYESELAAERAEAAAQALRDQEPPSATHVESINPIHETNVKGHESSPAATSSMPNMDRLSNKVKREREFENIAEEKPRKKVKRDLPTADDKASAPDSAITQSPPHIESKKKRLPLQARSDSQSQAQLVHRPASTKATSSGLALTSDEDKNITRCPENKVSPNDGMCRRSTRTRSLSRKAGEMALLCDSLRGANTDKQRKTSNIKPNKPKKARNKAPAKAKAPKGGVGVEPSMKSDTTRMQDDENVLNQIVTELTNIRSACQSGDPEGARAAKILMNMSAAVQH